MFFETMAGGFIGAVVHEAAHAGVARMRGLKVKGLAFSMKGVGVIRERGTDVDTICIAIAGPLVNLILASMFWQYEGFRIANLILAIVNLLPIPGSDGRKILDALRGCDPDDFRRAFKREVS